MLGRLDLEHTAMMGHSLCGTTTVTALADGFPAAMI